MATAGLISGILSALGGVAGGVAGAAHGGPPSPLAQKGGVGMGFQPSATRFQSGAPGGPQGADLRLSEVLGRPAKRPEDEMTLGMMMGGMGGGY